MQRNCGLIRERREAWAISRVRSPTFVRLLLRNSDELHFPQRSFFSLSNRPNYFVYAFVIPPFPLSSSRFLSINARSRAKHWTAIILVAEIRLNNRRIEKVKRRGRELRSTLNAAINYLCLDERSAGGGGGGPELRSNKSGGARTTISRKEGKEKERKGSWKRKGGESRGEKGRSVDRATAGLGRAP